MSGVEEADVTKVDRLLKKHAVGYHPTSDEVPQRPHVLEVLEGRAPERRRAERGWLEAREGERRTLQQPERVTGLLVNPALDWAKVCI